MEATVCNSVTMTQLHRMAGGMGTSNDDFIVCKDLKWDNSVLGNAYQAQAAGMVLCRKGTIRFRVNLEERCIREGDLMIYGPNNVVSILEKSDDASIDLLFFSPQFMGEGSLGMEMIMPILTYFSEEGNGLLELEPDESEIIEQYYTLLRDSMQFGKTRIIHDLLAVMFRTVSELYSRRLEAAKGTAPKTRQQDYFERFLKQVALFYREQRSVKFYADALFITPKYLSTVIKEISGRSAAEWINDFVIREARMMLRMSNKSVQEITYELNFSTQSFFGKYFKRHTGISPSQYRARELA